MFSVVRLAARRLRRTPSFTIAAALTLALGIGGAVAVFTVLDGVLLQPLPYPRASALVDLSHTLAVAGLTRVDQSDATYLLYRRDNHSFTDVGIYRTAAVNFLASAGAAGVAATPERVAATFATASTFHVLQSGALRGRALSDMDDRIGAAPVVVISRGLWERAFGGDPGIIGTQVMIDGVARTVVGVMPNNFRFPDAGVALWLPLALDAANTNSAAFDYRGIARLRSGTTIASATADLRRLLPQVPIAFPGRLTADGITSTHMVPAVQPLRDVMTGSVTRVLWILFGAVIVLLLVACANVANLFLARAAGRTREFAIRNALGAGRRALLGELLAEALVLSAIGGAIGLVLASAGVQLLQSLDAAAAIPRLADVQINWYAVVFTVVVVAIAALVVSVIPLVRGDRESLSATLIANAPSASGGRQRHRARRALVVSQVALALLLLSAAGLFARSFERLRAVQPGFDAQHALTFRQALPTASYPSASAAAREIVETVNTLAALPSVQGAGAATRLPLDATSPQDSAVFIEDQPLQPGTLPGIHHTIFATPGYFAAMKIPMIAGRTFAPLIPGADSTTVLREVVVSEAFAARYWKSGGAVGKRIRMFPGDPWSTIVGVVGSVHDDGLDQPAGAVVYIPMTTVTFTGAPWTPRDLVFVVRGSGDPAGLAVPVREAVTRMAPALPLYRMLPLETLLVATVSRTSFTLLLLGVAAVVAMAIGATGIYGVIAYLVSLRTREIGVRLALGAKPSSVRRLVVRHAVSDAAIGVAVGIVGAVLLARVMAGVLFDVSPTDPLTLAAAAAILLVTAVAAAWLPARRAARLDPVTALRSE
ncbi:MAG TPA: ABC transporter permease [Gemmatimonadales bacterium]|jgi:predicted permease